MAETTNGATLTPTIRGPDPNPRRPRLNLPPGACDCHAHIFGPHRLYPLAQSARYVPPEASVESLVQTLRTIGCQRAVIVQPSAYGTDNRRVLDALRSGAFAFRGIAVIDDATSDSNLEDMHRAGVRGVRMNIRAQGSAASLDGVARLADRIKPRGWHMQFHLNVNVMPGVARQLEKLPVPIVIDHFAHAPAAAGVESDAFRFLLRLARSGRCWFKLMGPYRISRQPPLFPDVTPLARALLAVAPDRCVWATDWPHPNAEFMPNDGDLADLLLDWIPDDDLRRKVLVENPARLYDFQ